jgi:hypothetical protein
MCAIRPDEQIKATHFLNTLGSLIYFNDKSKSLNNLVILDPHWLYECIATIITRNQAIKDGTILHSHLDKIWPTYPGELYPQLLLLMENFKVSRILKNFGVNMFAELFLDCITTSTIWN